MNKKTKTIIIGVGALLVLLAVLFAGIALGKIRTEKRIRPHMVSYQSQIDSLRFRVDTLLAHIDPDFTEKERVVYRTKIKYIIQKQENEKQEYFALDTSGRVANFRERVRARMGKRDKPIEVGEDWGVDELLRN